MLAYVFLGLFTATTYLLGGIAREQVCIYMCPWPRIQGAMFDRDSLLVTYRDFRGEPRGPHKKGAELGRPRRLHRLQGLRRRLPDGHRHPQRRAARVHPVRAVHRRLRRDHARSAGRRA